MAKLVVINKHDGGMTNDPRDPRVDVQRNIQHFDNYTNPYKLTPYRSLKQDGTEVNLNNLLIQRLLAANSTIYGLGIHSDGTHTALYGKTTSSDPTSAWTELTNAFNTGVGNRTAYVMFLYYHGFLFCDYSGGVSKYDVTNQVFTYNDYTTNVPSGQGIIHSADDIMYFPSSNKIIYNKTTDGSGYGVGFTLPTNATINAICEFGNYLAIMYTTPDNKITVGLWDRDTTNTAFSEKIDWGQGKGALIETVEGVLCGVSIVGGTTATLTPRIQFKSYEYSYLSGYVGLNTVNIFAEFVVANAPTIVAGSGFRFNQILYFLATITFNGNTLNGLWKIYRNAQGAMVVSFDQLPMNGSSTPTTLYHAQRWGDYTFIALSDPANSDSTIYRTDDQANYTATSEWDTTINQGMTPEDRIEKKKLLAVGVLYESLPSGASVTVQYRVDGGSWTTIFTESTAGKVRTEPYTRASGATAFTDGFEYEFRVQSTGGAEISSLVYKYDTIKTTTNS